MTTLPVQYQWLDQEPGPKMVVEGLRFYGLHEAPGGADNPIILSWAKELGLDSIYKSDEIAWCGLYAAYIAKLAGKAAPEKPLWALNWASFGQQADAPMLGDVLVFKRTGGGHVGFYVGQDENAFHVLGGNEGDAVNIIRISKTRLYRARRPLYKTTPANVRVIHLSATGALSTNEA